MTKTNDALHGPFGYLVITIGLDEEHWRLSDRAENDADHVSLPMFTKVDPFGHLPEGSQWPGPASAPSEGGVREAAEHIRYCWEVMQGQCSEGDGFTERAATDLELAIVALEASLASDARPRDERDILKQAADIVERLPWYNAETIAHRMRAAAFAAPPTFDEVVQSIQSDAGSRGEPVAWRWRYEGEKAWCMRRSKPNDWPDVEMQPLYTHPAPASPSGETVAWTVYDWEYYDAIGNRVWAGTPEAAEKLIQRGVKVTPVYVPYGPPNAHPAPATVGMQNVLHEALQEAREQILILHARLGIDDSGSGTIAIIDSALAKMGHP